MGGWWLVIFLGMVLIFVGLYTHWSIMLIGAVLPFVPVVSELWRRRRRSNRAP